MPAECMKQMAEQVRRLRLEAKQSSENRGITPDSKQGYYEDGLQMGFTKVLELIDPNPYN